MRCNTCPPVEEGNSKHKFPKNARHDKEAEASRHFGLRFLKESTVLEEVAFTPVNEAEPEVKALYTKNQ